MDTKQNSLSDISQLDEFNREVLMTFGTGKGLAQDVKSGVDNASVSSQSTVIADQAGFEATENPAP